MNVDLQDIINFFGSSPWITGFFVLGTFLIFIMTFYQQAAVPLWNTFFAPFGKFVKAVAETPQAIEGLSHQVKALVMEIKPNGGMSLKDALHRLEETMAVAEGQRLIVMNTMKDAVFLANPDGTIKWGNKALLEMVGGNMDAILGKNWVNVIHREDREFVIKEWESVRKDVRNLDLQCRITNLITQETFRVHAVATPLFCFRNKLVGYNGVVYKYPMEVRVDAAKITIETTPAI